MDKYSPLVEDSFLFIWMHDVWLRSNMVQLGKMTGWRDSYISVLDSWFFPVQAFLSDYTSFKEKIADMELRLGFIVCQAFDDCPGCESAFKVTK